MGEVGGVGGGEEPFPGISHTVRDLLLASGDDTVVRCSREDKSVELRRRAARTQTQTLTLTPSRRRFEETGAASSTANKHVGAEELRIYNLKSSLDIT